MHITEARNQEASRSINRPGLTHQRRRTGVNAQDPVAANQDRAGGKKRAGFRVHDRDVDEDQVYQ